MWVAIGIAAVVVVVIMVLYNRSRKAEQRKLRRDTSPVLQRPAPPVSSAADRAAERAQRIKARKPVVLTPAAEVQPPPPPLPSSAPRPAGASAEQPDPKVGDRVAVFAEIAGREQLSFVAEHRHRYEMHGNEWFEVTGKVGGKEAFLEIWGGSEPGLAAGLGAGELGLQQIGLTEEMLIGYDERPGEMPPFEFDGSSWTFRASGEVMFYEDCGREAEGCYYWEFDEKDGKRLLFVEKWEDEPFEAGICTRVEPGQVFVSHG